MTASTSCNDSPLRMTDLQLQQLKQAIAHARKNYSQATHMLCSPFASPGYHTTYRGPTVHQTRHSLIFAVALLDTGEPEDLHDACDIITAVINLQDQDPASHTYGIWPWFLEEPIAQMDPPDWNWADFCGSQLLEARLTHADRLPAKLLQRMDEAIRHAATSIRKRDVELDYTNIVIMGSFVTLMAGKLLGDESFTSYATDRLKRFHAYTFAQGSFSEYNSPPYSVVALNELLRLKRFIGDGELSEIVNSLYELGWEEIAQHFHPQTAQWAGPHSRCYQTLLTIPITGMLQRALAREDTSPLPTLDQHRLAHRCPKRLLTYFENNTPEANSVRSFKKTFVKGPPEIVGTTYLHPEFSLGTVNYSELFGQRRSLLAYWGKPGSVRTLRLRFLHDGYDFSAAQFYSVQEGADVLGAIGFATDGGDRHPFFDRLTDGQFEAEDLRLRLQIEGVDVEQIRVLAMDSKNAHGLFDLDGLGFGIHAIEARFGDLCGQLDVSSEGSTYMIDIVFYSGKRRAFSFAPLECRAEEDKRVAIAFAAAFTPNPMVNFNPSQSTSTAAFKDGYTRYRWQSMQLIVPTVPSIQNNMRQIVTA